MNRVVVSSIPRGTNKYVRGKGVTMVRSIQHVRDLGYVEVEVHLPERADEGTEEIVQEMLERLLSDLKGRLEDEPN